MTRDVRDDLTILREGLAGRYADLEEISHGGMAVVYRARDAVHGRDVAIKVLREELRVAVGTERFLREIEVEAQLQHPHILPVFDSGAVEGRPYYVMPLVEGGTLRDRLRRERQLPVEEVITIGREVADALFYAHTMGVVHRDVKPENIMFSSGHAMLADFGIARAVTVAGGRSLTDSGIAIGTPPYMSPEQIGADPQVDGRSDIYSLGVVLYEMLAGDPPFAGSTAQAVLNRILADSPPSLEIVRPHLPSGLLDVVERCLEKIPADRFRTAADVGRRLAAAPRTKPRHRFRLRTLALITAILVGTTAAAITLFRPDGLLGPRRLDAQKLLVLPFAERGGEAGSGVGQDAALAIVRGLEYAPVTALDGWYWLGEAERANSSALTPDAARALARERRAGLYLTGLVDSGPDSLTVRLLLYDTGTDTLVTQASEAAARTQASVGLLALSALLRLLPAVLDPGRPWDLGPLLDRQTAAVAQWLRGEREYRSSHFREALASFQRALAQDSNLVIAAVKGAQAATWVSRFAEAADLAQLAVERDTLLPVEYRLLARGVGTYIRGEADSAERFLDTLILRWPDWPDARMTRAEVYYHLVTSEPGAEERAATDFRAALAADPAFTPALMHLIEHTIQRGLLDSAARLLAEYRTHEPDSSLVPPLVMALQCASGHDVPWVAEARGAAVPVLQAGLTLAGAATWPRCAADAFRAVLGSPVADEGTRWGALVALQGILLASGRAEEAVQLLDSALEAGESLTYVYYVLGTMAGASWGSRAAGLDALITDAFGGDLTRIAGGQDLLILGYWYAFTGDTVRLKDALRAVEAKPEGTMARRNRMCAAALRAHLTLARGDTSGAIAGFRALRSVGPRTQFAWTYAEPLAVERLRLAELLAARGQWAEAFRAAEMLDHPYPVVFWEFVRPSLDLRLEAARQLGNRRMQDQVRNRLIRLGQTDPELR